jgi:hypothetical protein
VTNTGAKTVSAMAGKPGDVLANKVCDNEAPGREGRCPSGR